MNIKEKKIVKPYFNLNMLKDYGEVVDKTYNSQSKEANWFYQTREKLYYLVDLLSNELNEKFIVVYKEKPNGQRGPSLIGFKNYILAGFAPTSSQIQDDLFMKLEFANINEKAVLAINIDLNFRKKTSPFYKNRDVIYNKHYKEWVIDENFPNNWEDLIRLLSKDINKLKESYEKYLIDNSKKSNVKNEFILWFFNLPTPKYTALDEASLNIELDNSNNFFDKDIFDVDNFNFIETIEFLNDKINIKGSPFYDYSAKIFNHRPRAILGKNNYIQFLKEKFENVKKEKNIYSPSLNQIFYGPPGTGKTYNTVLEAAKIITGDEFISYDKALEVFNNQLGSQIEFVTFHQNYSYEDFIQGLRPETELEGTLSFYRKDGVFKRLSDEALKNYKESNTSVKKKSDFQEVFDVFFSSLIEGEVEEIEIEMKKVSYFITNIKEKSIEFRKASGGTDHTLSISTLKDMYDDESVKNIQGLSYYYKPLLTKFLEIGKSVETEYISLKNYVIIIDEINRANISRVFGELITLIEKDKRYGGKIPLTATLPSGKSFTIPPNLYIIGTMNTADKSIALLDIALRRRFEFKPMYPKYQLDNGILINNVELLEKINKEIINRKGHDFTIGHAYFMGEDYSLENTINNKVIPLLLEYFMNDEKEVQSILNSAGVKVEGWPMQFVGND